eukprot:6190521-Amphidinium_carterae.1
MDKPRSTEPARTDANLLTPEEICGLLRVDSHNKAPVIFCMSCFCGGLPNLGKRTHKGISPSMVRMAWNASQVAFLMNSLAALQQTSGGKPGNLGTKDQVVSFQGQTKKNAAGTSWDCPICGFYNFGYRSTCFACKRDKGDAKLNKTGGPASKQEDRLPRQEDRLQSQAPTLKARWETS